MLHGKTMDVPHNPRPKLDSLELGRFLAAIYVLLAHVVPDVNAHAAPGAAHIWSWLGVTGGGAAIEYFFVLSGFVMACSHGRDFGQRRSAPYFWWKRARRIYPMYWLGLIIGFAYLQTSFPPGDMLKIITLVPAQVNEFLPPAWTLRYGMTFYIMFGLCLLPYIGRPLLAAWILATFWHWWPYNQLHMLHLPQPAALYWFGNTIGVHFVSFLDIFFFAGLASGWAFMSLRPGKKSSIAITLGGIILAVALRDYMNFGGPNAAVPMIALVAITIAVLILGVAGMERHGTLHLPRASVWAGIISYPLYILHAALLTLFWHSLAAFQLGIFILTGLAAFLIDQPLQRWLRRWDNARPPTGTAQQAAA
jgi:exopolysaccharide production protein ExoZ